MSYIKDGQIHFSQAPQRPAAPALLTLSAKEVAASAAAFEEAQLAADAQWHARQQAQARQDAAAAEERRAIDRLTARVQRGRARGRLGALLACLLPRAGR